jgi:hypothetical protein
MEGLATIYKEHLNKTHPWGEQVFDNMHLNFGWNWFAFIDRFTDMSVLVYEKNSNKYDRYNRFWIKEKIRDWVLRNNKPCEETVKMLG